MKFLQNSKKQKEELAMVFDVGSSSVGGSVFMMTSSGAPRIMCSVREPIELRNDLNLDQFLELTLKTLRDVTGKICMKGLGKPEKVFCVISSPWYASQTRSIHLERNTSFVFNEKLAKSLIDKETKLFEEEHVLKYGEGDHKIRTIEVKTMETVLNGYHTKNPFGQKAEALDMTVFISMSQDSFLKEIEKNINRHFHVEKIFFSSFVMSSFMVARDMFVSQENFLLINIGGEVTDISMIKKDTLRESISFPMGRNFIIRGVSDGLNCTIAEARSFISLYKDGHMAESLLRKIDPIMTAIKNEWLKNFQTTLSRITRDISVPATIFITVEQDLADFFSQIIRTEQFNQYTLTESKFRVIFLGLEALHGIATIDKGVIRDPFLIIESIYANKFLQQS